MQKYLLSTIFLLLVFLSPSLAQEKFNISGYIKEVESGEALIGAHIIEQSSRKGVSSNVYGFYSLSLPAGEVKLQITSIGQQPQLLTFDLQKDTTLNFDLQAQSRELEAVEVTAERAPIMEPQGSVNTLNAQQLRQRTPQLIGEVDVMKSLQMLPGVQGGKEGSTDLSVRGGDPGQNLILLDGVPVYNATHMLGLLSVFNSDAIKQVKMVKGGFPARYGGRLSSVIDIQLKEGNREEIGGAFEAGIISSKLTVDGPINEKSSFLISGRISPLSFLAEGLQKISGERQRTNYYLYDLNAKGNYEFSEKSKLYLSLYGGGDNIGVDYTDYETPKIYDQNKFGMDWGNLTSSLRWNWQPHKKLFINTTAIYSDYSMGITMERAGQFLREETFDDYVEYSQQLAYRSGIEDLGLKVDIDYFPAAQHMVKAGVEATYHTFRPQAVGIELEVDTIEGQVVELIDTLQSNNNIGALEYKAYVEDDWKIGEYIRLNAGLHFSNFQVRDTTYRSLQPRLALNIKLGDQLSFRSSYARMQQNLHLLRGSGQGLPTDIWVPSTDKVRPEESWQATAGFAGRWNWLNFEVEGYYKEMQNVLDFTTGTDFLRDGPETDLTQDANRSWENRMLTGRGEAYGLEVLLEKPAGRLTASLAYTLAWSNRQFDKINLGEVYPFRYDRRHSINTAVNYQLTENINLGANWTYQSGYWMSLPEASYALPGHLVGINGSRVAGPYESTYSYMPNERIDYFGEKNNFRTPAYHRLDVYASFRKEKKKTVRTWNVGLYNAYNRKNPYLINASSFSGKLTAISVFTILPSVSYRLEF